jgi:hypothetical protein
MNSTDAALAPKLYHALTALKHWKVCVWGGASPPPPLCPTPRPLPPPKPSLTPQLTPQ